MDFNFPHGPPKIEILKELDPLYVKSSKKFPGSSHTLMIVKEIERGLSLSTWTKNFNVDFLWQREEYPGGYRKESPGQGGQRMSTLTFFDTLSEITSVCNVLLVANEGQR